MPTQLIQVQNLFKTRHFPKMCFFKDEKQQHIQRVWACTESTSQPQMSDESFHDANEEYMPSDDDFMHNYMVCVYKTSLQQKTGTSSKFQWIKHFVKVKLKPYHTHAVYMHAYVGTGANVNLMPQDMYIKLYNDDNLKHLKPSYIKLGVLGDDQIALLGKCNIYLVHRDIKKSVEVTFYVADKSGSTLLSCATSLKLDLIKLHPRLGVPPPRAKIITSQEDWASPAAKRTTQGKVMFDEMQSTVEEPLVIEKWARYQNDQHDEMSSLVPRSAPYEDSKHAEWPKHLTTQPHCSTPPFKRDNFPIQHHKIHQNVQLNKQRKMHPLRPPECSQQPNQQHSKQYVYIYWKIQKQ